MSRPKKLLIMAAGTGGHIFPGLAIAETMKQKGWEVSWLGTQAGMEGDIVTSRGFEIDKINFSGLRGKGLAHMLTGSVRLMTSYMSCLNIMTKRQPDIVVGMGGYVTVPGGMAAKSKGIPVVVINADAKLLLSNKALAASAKKILFGFPGDYGNLKDKAILTGNPVRDSIKQLGLPKERYDKRSGALNILVVGGSLGAQALNECVPQALEKLPFEMRPRVIHQTGRAHIAQVRQLYRKVQVLADVVDFIDDMDKKYAQVDLVICRSGAITVSELTCAGVASILVPFVATTTSHQRDNAMLMANAGASIYIEQKDFTPDALANLLKKMTREKCLDMANQAYAMGRRDANEKIASVLIDTVNKEK